MKLVREITGYLVGFILFLILIPYLMWKISAFNGSRSLLIWILFAIIAVAGIGLSVWSIVYMKRVGKGNPMDAFNHEVAPRTSVLMTKGPYRLCRNPMLLGILIYYADIVLLLRSLKAAAIFVVFVGIMMIQVKHEEARLEQEFGDDYREYKGRTKRVIPFVW